MTTVQFVAQLGRKGIRVWAEGDALRFSAPPQVMTAEVRGEIAARKPELMAFLRRAGTAARVHVPRVARGGALPLSFAQARLWFLDQLEPGSAFYNLPAARRLRGPLDVGALERAVGEVVRRHASLRTVFRRGEGDDPVQVELATPEPYVPRRVDLGGQAPEAREAALARLAAQDAEAPFDLARGPLFRATLVRMGDEDHALLMCMHHIVSDGWSMGVLFRELSALYAAFCRGEPSPLPELPVQYADYAVWQREHLRGQVLDAQVAYWTERLAGAPTLLELPTDRPRPAVQGHRGALLNVVYGRELRDGLQALARREGATLYMVLLTAFQVLLSRYARQHDVVVGSPIAGRTRTEVEGLIGFFVNTLAIRTDLRGDPAYRALLARVREEVMGAYEHQDVPFEKLVEELHPERSMSHSPIFQVMFALQNVAGADLEVEGVRTAEVQVQGQVAKFDLTVAVEEVEQGLRVWVEYDTDLFDLATIHRMLGHFRLLLEGVAANPDARISALPLLTGPERQVLQAWNRTGAAYPRQARIHDRFEEHAARAPERTALVFGTQELSYGALNARANRLAHRLRAVGVGPGVPVGICLERTPDLVAGLLAVLKAGGVYLPLDPAYPPERLAFMLADAAAPVLLTQARLRDRVSPAPPRVVLVHGQADEGGEEEDRDPPPSATAADLAYLIYTSGSTGRPKGVQIEHRNAVAFLEWAAEEFADEVLRGVLASTSVSFDLSVFEIFLPLSRGGCVVLAENALQLAELPARDRVTLVNTVPSAGAELVRMGAIPPSVRVVNLAGEALPRELVDAVYARTSAHAVYNLYGPSEDTTYSTFARVAPGEARAPSIGRPISNTRVYLLDPRMALLPVGVPGELYLAGDGLARGYLGRPALTAERFVPDPFSPVPGARLYRTGDLARWAPDGTLDYLGRMDHQVKVRGFRVELGEIESALAAHPAVRDVVVLAREDVPGDRRLVAYVVPRQGADADAGALRDHVRASLPEYMVPAAVVVLERLPATPNGKVDRKALPAPAWGGGAAGYVAPRTPVEEVLAGIWGEVLGVERVGARDNFFDLGGHSLIATRVLSRVRRVLGAEVPLRTLFWHPTVQGLALEVERVQRGRSDAAPLPPVEPAPRDGPLPLSFGQRRLWFLDRLEPESPFYNIPSPRRLHGALDAGALERALGEVVRRHEALRTVFREDAASDPVQVVLPAPDPYVLPTLDLRDLPPDAREAELARRVADDAVTPFDLAHGPLFRVALVRLADDDHALLMCTHHIVSDGWSIGVLYAELGALYTAYRAGRPSPLAELPVQYADHAVWQHRHLHGRALEAQLAFWNDRLAGAPTLLELPTDRPRPAVQSLVGGIVGATVPAELRDALAALARREGATLYMVLLAAFQLLLSRYARQDDVVVGSPIAGRTRTEVEGLIGFFVNTLVLRTDVSGDPTFRGLLQRVRNTALEAYAHQDVPFEQLVQELRVPRSLSHSPLFQVMFGLQNVPDGDLEMAGLRARVFPDTAATARFDLMVLVHDGAEGLTAYVEYAAALFDAATVERLMRHFGALLRAAVHAPDAPVSDLSMLPDDERALVVGGWNETARPVAEGVCVPHLFAWGAALHPGAPALEMAGETLTYAQVDARSNRLARRLRGMGVGPDVRVAVSLERSVDMPVAVLAVLKAGGAYVAVDPGYPPDRVAYMLRDSRAAVLVTTSAVATRLPRGETPLLLLDAHAQAIAAEHDGPLPVQGDPENLAYVLYTSGTTGRPKGAALPHRALVNLLHWQLARFGDGAAARTLQFASLSFDVSFQEIFSTWAAGGCLVLVDEDTRRDTEALVGYLREQRIQRLFLPFAALQNLAETAEGARLPEMREIITAGEALRSTPQLLALYRANPGLRLDNHYGPSETHVVSAHLLADDAGTWPLLPPIGAPIQNVRLYVLDAWMRPVPIGVPGELYLGGAGVARGYLGRPGLTAERFVPDPYGEPGSRLYRSGDGARWVGSGELEYLGRLDQQVKVRGFRIEPGEIEGVLATHPGVRQAVVVVREDPPGDRRLVAYVVSPGGVGAAELREHARTRLPDYMVPSAFVPLDALPLTPNGKLDQRALPAPEASGGLETYVAPRTPAEEVLAAIWSEVLGVERVGVRDSFFDLGGHSLLATRVISRVRAQLGAEVPLRALFGDPTVEGLGREVERARGSGAAVLPPVERVDREQPLPLSFAQQRLWFLDQYEQGSAFYNIPAAVRLSGTLDAGALERGLGEVVRRHEALRTVFRAEGAEAGAQAVQVILPAPASFHLPVHDLRGLAAQERETALARLAEEDAREPFDLARGPLFRAALVRMADEDHALLLCMHHVVSDGWSLGVLFRELGALYEAYRDGREAGLPELPVQYADYAAWQHRHLRGEVLEGELGYWRERLAGAPALLELPTDRPRPAVQGYRGAFATAVYAPEVQSALRALARREGATLYMVLLAGFQLLLSRYSRQEDVVVGSPIAGRTRSEVEGLIGFFLNTLVLRTDLSGAPTFRELLGRVREVTLEAYAHQQVPFEKLVEELRPERSLAHTPLFQVMFILQNNAGGELRLDGVRARAIQNPGGAAKFDLTLAMAESEEGLGAWLEYNTDLFDATTAEQLLAHLGVLLQAAAAVPEEKISRLPLLTAEERARLIAAGSGTDAGYPRESVHQLFAAQAARTPDAVAVSFEGRSLTYAQLATRADALARRLRAAGVGPGVLVGICVERGPEMVAGLLGILKAGGAYVPLDPSYPADRLAFMLEDAAVPVLLTEPHLRDALPFHGRVLLVGEECDHAEEVIDPRGREAAAEDLAYVIYTSGSTGRPKGVQIPHRALTNFLVSMRREPGLTALDRLLAVTTLSFDIAALELYLPLVSGAEVRLVSRETAADGARLREELEQGEVTVMQATPATWRMLVDAGWEGDPRLKVLCGGEALTSDLRDDLLHRTGEVWNVYGPTETTIWSTLGRVSADRGAADIGRPVANTRVHVLDGEGEPVPAGVPGELLIGGDGVARGYLGRPALTAERFVPGPDGERLYRTGDLVRRRADGALEFIGRVDHQVKVRGFRIEPGEVESVLATHPAVRQAVVMAREDAPGDRRLVAYLVADGRAPTPAELREHARGRLPEYMVPTAWVLLDRLPLTPNGKVDRKALPAPEGGTPAEEYVAPRTPVEEALAAIWADVLGTARVGVHDNFFELGGHSLLATRVISRIRQHLAAELPLRALFAHATVQSLAGEVESALRGAGTAVLPPVAPVDRRQDLPLSFAQARLWFLDQYERGSAFYNIPAALRLSGPLDAGALERALGEVVHRHEVLRTVFRVGEDGQPVQVILPAPSPFLAVHELRALADGEREAALERLAREDWARPFDLVEGPLFRAALVRLGDEDHALLMCMHHVVSDAWSLGVLFHELGALYRAFAEGNASPLAALPVQYADYAVWQRQHLRGAVLDAQVAYWRERLSGSPTLLELPTDRPRPAVQSYRGAAVGAVYGPELQEALRTLARGEGATLYMVLLAGFQLLLSRYARQDDVVVGSPIAGRTRAEVEALIGFFVNTLVLRTDLGGAPTFRQVVARVREVTLGAYAHQDVPFEKLVEELRPGRSLSHTAIFQVMFQLQNQRAADLSLPGVRVNALAGEPGTAKFDLSLAMAESDQGLRVWLTYNTDLFDRATAERLLDHLRVLLQGAALRPGEPVARLSLLSADERARLLEEGRPGAVPHPRDAAVHQLFERQVDRDPHAPAVVHDGEWVTYGALDARANQLAHRLRALGVGPETRVGVCAEHGPDLLVALLGTLKAGGAYVPLDPTYPVERQAYVLADARVPVLLAQTRLRHALPAGDAAVVCLDGDRAALDAEDPGRLSCAVHPGGLAYVIYTSGSTGQPKGVEIAHGSLANLVASQARTYGMGPADRQLVFASIGFDASVAELCLGLCTGAALHTAPPERLMPGPELLALLRERQITCAKFPPTALAAMEPEPVPSLRLLLLGGEAWGPELGERWAEPGRRIFNVYGPTETTIRATTGEWRPGGAVRLGPPVDNVRVYVLDPALEPAPIGVPGELYVGGDGVARGYLGRPGLTAERFVPAPWGERLYRTGDLVRRRAGGDLEFLGRLDHQVKVRGFRIEPGEIESVLAAHPAVRSVVVLAREDVPGDRRLVAYVVAGEGAEAGAGALREHARAALPEHMVPAAFVFLDDLPRTPNGKLDRAALPAPEWRGGEDAHVAPRTPVEEVLAGIWGEVLGVERVGARESFFDLGGHSLLATQVLSRVRRVLGVEVPLRTLFGGPTVEALAREVERVQRGGGAAALLPPVEPAPRDGPLPLSFAQRRLWFLDQLEPGSAFYNIASARRLRGPLDAGALERALGEVVRRHEALRTVFRVDAAGDPVQVVLPAPDPYVLPTRDLRDLPPDAREAELARRVADDAVTPFDLAQGPLFRAALVRLAPDDHALLLCMHHIVGDGWSTGVLHRELGALYDAFRRGEPSPLAALPVQYADFAVWQHRHLGDQALQSQLAFWKDRLAGAPTLLELPTDRPRPPVQSYRGAGVTDTWPRELQDALRALARQRGATLHMVLLAAFQVLLWRWSRQQDVVVGSPVAGRTRAEVEGLVGFFVNTLAFRTDLGQDPAFHALLARVRDQVLEGYAHQDVPFERLVEELRPERSMSHAPVFQVMFALQNAAGDELRLAGVETGLVDGGGWMAKFDLTLTVAEDEQAGLRVWLGYAADLFDAATAERMLEQLRVLLQGVAARPDTPISALPLLSAPARAALLRAWSPAEAPSFPVQGSLHGRFRAQAARTPHAPAATFEGRSVTYAELDARSDRLARRLVRAGVAPEARVGICVERGLEMVTGLLAILKAGGAYVPLDPAYPAERLAYVVKDARIRVLLAGDDVRSKLPVPGDVQVVSLSLGEDEDAGGAGVPGDGGVRTENAAYVIYTSGSTGRPKGVQVTHGNVLRLLDATDGWFGFGAGDVWTLFHSYAFDFSVWELWGALLYGGRLVVVPFLVSRSPEDFYRLLVREQVTVLNQTPSAFRQLIAAEEAVGQDPALALRTVVFGGEALEPASLRPWVKRHGYDRPRLVNMYGITETTVHVTYRPITPEDVERGSRSPVGIAIPDLRVYVLDGRLEPCPVGVPGEMLVGGAGMARGYLGRPGLTAERFVPDPYGEPGSRLYRSGDGARWVGSGELEYLGRLDQQVKVRGFRIEPGEIEGVLATHPGVRQAVVVVREDPPGDRRLVAYVVSPGGVGAAELREHARTRLPDYMVPAAFVPLDALPLTPNGKLDQRALPAPEAGESLETYVAPRTPAEEVLAAIWSEVLGVERVGVRDSFFDLGGHSLLATRVISRVRAQLGAEVPLRALFGDPTVEGLGREVERARGSGAAVLPPVERVDREQPLPLSFAQQRLWFLDQYEQGSAFYNIPAAVRLSGTLDAGALERGLGEVVRRHEALRTVFRAEGAEAGAQAVQVILPAPASFHLPVHDLRGLAAQERETALARLAEEDAREPFDLARGPLFRAALVRMADEDHALLLCMHHVVSDGWSLGVLFRELGALYQAYRDGREAGLPELPVQYADYAAWQHRHLRGEVLEGELGYWRERLSGAPALLELPTDRPRPAVQGYRGAFATAVYAPEVQAALRALARREGATLYMVLLAGFQLLLSRYSRQEDVVVGSPIAGRTRSEVEGLIGFFLNTLVLRTDLSGAPSFRELLGRVREVTLEAYAHQQVPFEKLVEELRPERSLAHTPLFQVMFILQNNAGGELRLDGVRARAIQNPGGAAKFDLTLAMAESEEGLGAWLEYNTDLFDATTAEQLLAHLGVLLEAAAARPEERGSRLPLLTAEERARLIAAGSGTDAGYPRESVHQLFAAQAARTPEAAAVSFEDRSLTYAQLDTRADALARRLRAAGVAPGVLVGICVERGPEMVAGLLGILKAGGAYVPLDPSYPADRLAFMLEDAAVPVLLTEPHLRDALPFHGRVLLVGEEGDHAEAVIDPRGREAAAEDLAYVIYTSGSTGRPKGVQIPHRALTNFLVSMRREPGLTALDRLLAVTTLSFDIAALELYLPLVSGAEVRLVSRETAADGLLLREELERGAVSVMQATPATWRMLVDAGWEGDPRLKVLCGGEALTSDLRDDLLHRAGEVWNVYGPTETTIWSTLGRVSADRGAADIGRPLANTRVHVLDGEGEPVPAGVPGELLIGGDGVARGYLGRPALTAERFVPGPDGGRLYRTGDLVRRRADGALEFIGRVDHQVKVRGFRIEPGEVESVLAAHPAVRQAVVMAREDAPGDRRLVAYLVADGHAPTPAELREHARGRLPEYMVPTAWVLLDRLPLTPNGKVDRKALPAPEGGTPAEEYVAPRTPVEEALAAIWADVLGTARVGVHDNFFELGGHSLLAVRLMSRIERQTGRRLPLHLLFRDSTVARLARHLEDGAQDAARDASPLVAIQPGGTRPPLFCVHAIDGHVLSYARLARALGPDQPFLALRARGIEGEAAPSSSIPEMAARYLDAVRAVQPRGPYRLAGWSLGGVVAYEMARLLRARGERVEALALVDVPRAVPVDRVPDDVLLAQVLAHMLGGTLPDGFSQAEFRALAPQERLRRVRDAAVAAGAVEADFGLDRLERLIRVRRSHMFALQSYTPAEYDGPAWLLQAARTGTAPGREIPWARLVRGTLVHRIVPGNHFSILHAPGVEVLARHVAACLDASTSAAE